MAKFDKELTGNTIVKGGLDATGASYVVGRFSTDPIIITSVAQDIPIGMFIKIVQVGTDKVFFNISGSIQTDITTSTSIATGDIWTELGGSGGGGSGEVNTNSDAGSASDGEGLVNTKVGSDTPIKRLKAGTNISITSEANDLVINNTNSGGGLTVDGTSVTGIITGTNIGATFADNIATLNAAGGGGGSYDTADLIKTLLLGPAFVRLTKGTEVSGVVPYSGSLAAEPATTYYYKKSDKSWYSDSATTMKIVGF